MGRNKEVFGAELFTIHRSIRIFLESQETGVEYTMFSDPAAAIKRAMMD